MFFRRRRKISGWWADPDYFTALRERDWDAVMRLLDLDAARNGDKVVHATRTWTVQMSLAFFTNDIERLRRLCTNERMRAGNSEDLQLLPELGLCLVLTLERDWARVAAKSQLILEETSRTEGSFYMEHFFLLSRTLAAIKLSDRAEIDVLMPRLQQYADQHKEGKIAGLSQCYLLLWSIVRSEELRLSSSSEAIAACVEGYEWYVRLIPHPSTSANFTLGRLAHICIARAILIGEESGETDNIHALKTARAQLEMDWNIPALV